MVSELKQRQNLVRRGDTYSVRLMIPKDIQPLYGTAREKIKALGTSDRAEAEARKHAVLAAFHEEFQAHRRRREPTLTTSPRPLRKSIASLLQTIWTDGTRLLVKAHTRMSGTVFIEN